MIEKHEAVRPPMELKHEAATMAVTDFLVEKHETAMVAVLHDAEVLEKH